MFAQLEKTLAGSQHCILHHKPWGVGRRLYQRNCVSGHELHSVMGETTTHELTMARSEYTQHKNDPFSPSVTKN